MTMLRLTYLAIIADIWDSLLLSYFIQISDEFSVINSCPKQQVTSKETLPGM